jgi:hypothetical protein
MKQGVAPRWAGFCAPGSKIANRTKGPARRVQAVPGESWLCRAGSPHDEPAQCDALTIRTVGNLSKVPIAVVGCYSFRITIKPAVDMADAKRDAIRRKNKMSSSSPRLISKPVADKIVVTRNISRVPISTHLNTSLSVNTPPPERRWLRVTA